MQVYCWSATGERQTQKFRERYVNALLSQEIGWFDTIGAGQLSTRVAEVVGKVRAIDVVFLWFIFNLRLLIFLRSKMGQVVKLGT